MIFLFACLNANPADQPSSDKKHLKQENLTEKFNSENLQKQNLETPYERILLHKLLTEGVLVFKTPQEVYYFEHLVRFNPANSPAKDIFPPPPPPKAFHTGDWPPPPEKDQHVHPEPSPVDNFKSYHGKRITENDIIFTLIGVRITEDEDKTHTFIDLFFTEEINPLSIKDDSLLTICSENQTVNVNNTRQLKANAYRFMKNSKGVRFEISENQDIFDNNDLIIQQITSWKGIEMIPVRLSKIECNCQFHFSGREKEWKKMPIHNPSEDNRKR